MRTHVDLFAGIGAMSIAAERAGYTTTHCVETDPFCARILRKRFPGAKLWGDIRRVTYAGAPPDLLTMGFPCQGLSSAGLGAGLRDDRSALWFEGLRLIRETRPKLVLIENVAALRSRGLDVVVRGLADAGYGCWWDCVPALAVGAPHLRNRIWITAVPITGMPPLQMAGVMPNGTKWSRAGGHARPYGPFQMTSQATVRMCKEAAGAVKRADGVTWLTKLGTPLWPTPASRDWKNVGGGRYGRRQLPEAVRREGDSPLFPTPSASSYGSNQGGAAGRVGPVRHSLASMARSGEWPTPRLWPTPERSDGTGGRVARELGGVRPSGAKRAITLGTAVAHEQRLWPTPRAAGRVVPAPSQSAGSLNPPWVEALMILPVGWTDPGCEIPVQWHWSEGEPPIPRVAAGVEHRSDRLKACGNSLVWLVALQRLEQAHRLLEIDA